VAVAREGWKGGARFRDWAHRPGRVLVYDTNSLMHYQPPGLIDWAALAPAPQLRLVVPLVVIDELDRKIYAGSEKMARRATAALRALDQLLDGAGPGAAGTVPKPPAWPHSASPTATARPVGLTTQSISEVACTEV